LYTRETTSSLSCYLIVFHYQLPEQCESDIRRDFTSCTTKDRGTARRHTHRGNEVATGMYSLRSEGSEVSGGGDAYLTAGPQRGACYAARFLIALIYFAAIALFPELSRLTALELPGPC
jgi:hypothetical protein